MAATASARVNNSVYDGLGERWYEATDDPIALLRAEATLRSPWVSLCLKSRHGAAARVLDMGCGAGFLSNALAREGYAVTGIDTSEASLAVARAHDATGSVTYRRGDATQLPFADASFDAVCAMDLLEHISPPEAILREVSRVLRPGGTFFFHTFNRNWLSWLVVIKGVEWFVRNTPAHLHVIELFIKPKELEDHCRRCALDVRQFFGMKPVVWSRGFTQLLLTGRITKGFRFEFCRSTRLAYLGFAERSTGFAPPGTSALRGGDVTGAVNSIGLPGWGARIVALVRLGRPQFLPGGVVAFALGTSIAYFDSGAIDWQSVFLGQLVVTSIQLMTHYSNDYFDFDGDRANSSLTRWSGGSGILSEGLLPRWVALCSAVAWATIAAVVIHLTYRRNPEGIVLASMLGMLVLAWFYSAPPLRLHTRGLGELTASIIVAGAVPALGYALQTGSLSSALLLGLLPFFLAQCAMLLIVSAPDIIADRASGKRTLLLRIGPGRAGFALCALLVLMYAILPLLTAAGLPKSVVLATSCTAPLAGLIFWWVRGGALDQPKMWPRLTESAVALVFLCALAATLGFALR